MTIFNETRNTAMSFFSEGGAIDYLARLFEQTSILKLDLRITRGAEDTCEFTIGFDDDEGDVTVRATSGALGHLFVKFSYALPNPLLATLIVKSINEFYFL